MGGEARFKGIDQQIREAGRWRREPTGLPEIDAKLNDPEPQDELLGDEAVGELRRTGRDPLGGREPAGGARTEGEPSGARTDQDLDEIAEELGHERGDGLGDADRPPTDPTRSPLDPGDIHGGTLPPTIDVNPGGYGEWDELQLERRAAERRREDEREQIEREDREWDEMVDSSLEMRDTPYSDLVTPEDVAKEMGGVPEGDTDEPNAAEDPAGTPPSTAGPVGRQAHDPHGITEPAEAAAGAGMSRSPVESVPEGRVPSAASPASSASSRQRETAKGDEMSDGPMSDREAEMAKRNAEINARAKAGVPVRPWNPVYIAKRAKSMSRAARQRAAAAGLVAVIAGLGLCATAAGAPRAQIGADADRAPAGAAPAAVVNQPASVDIAASQIEVTPTLLMMSGGCPGRVPLPPKTITNPQPGRTNVYVWETKKIDRGCGGGVSVELDYTGVVRKEAAVWTLFQPRTTARRAASGPGTPIQGAATIPPEQIVPGSGVQCTGIGTEAQACTYTLALVVTNESQ